MELRLQQWFCHNIPVTIPTTVLFANTRAVACVLKLPFTTTKGRYIHVHEQHCFDWTVQLENRTRVYSMQSADAYENVSCHKSWWNLRQIYLNQIDIFMSPKKPLNQYTYQDTCITDTFTQVVVACKRFWASVLCEEESVCVLDCMQSQKKTALDCRILMPGNLVLLASGLCSTKHHHQITVPGSIAPQPHAYWPHADCSAHINMYWSTWSRLVIQSCLLSSACS